MLLDSTDNGRASPLYSFRNDIHNFYSSFKQRVYPAQAEFCPTQWTEANNRMKPFELFAKLSNLHLNETSLPRVRETMTFSCPSKFPLLLFFSFFHSIFPDPYFYIRVKSTCTVREREITLLIYSYKYTDMNDIHIHIFIYLYTYTYIYICIFEDHRFYNFR